MTQQIETLTELISANPSVAQHYFDRGICYQAAGQRVLAIRDLDNAIRLNDQMPRFWLARGIINAELGSVTMAIRDLNQAVHLNPHDALILSTRAWFHKSIYRYKEALSDYDRAIHLDQLNSSYRCGRAKLLTVIGQSEQALTDLDYAIRLNPNDATFHYEKALVQLYYSEGVESEVILLSLDKAILLNPNADWYRMERGYVRFGLELWKGASEDFAAQSFSPRFDLCANMSLYVAIWAFLSKAFQGDSEAGLNFISYTLDWYTNMVTNSGNPSLLPEVELWPVPLARFITGEIGQTALQASLTSRQDTTTLAPIELRNLLLQTLEFDFVSGQLLLVQGKSEQAIRYLSTALGLPATNPMYWVARYSLNKPKRQDI